MKSSLPALRGNLPALKETLTSGWASSRYRRVVLPVIGYILLAGLVIVLVNVLSDPHDRSEASLELSLIAPVTDVIEDDPPAPEPSEGAAEEVTNAVTPPAVTAPAESEDSTGPYIAPFDRTDPRPRIALIVKNLGLQEAQSQKAILDLPPAVTLAFSPYSDNLAFWIEQSRAKRHESLIEIPMEPQSFPETDPGPLALFTRRSWDENGAVLDQIIQAENHHLGFINAFGNRFLADENQTRSFLNWINDRNSVFVEDLLNQPNMLSATIAEQMDMNYMASGIDITATPTPDKINEALRQLEEEAQKNGFALGTTSAYPVTLEIIKNWSAGLADRGIALAPLSAVLERKNETGIQESTL